MLFTDLQPADFAGATIFLDVDGTLAPDHVRILSEDVQVLLKEFVRHVDELYFCSNGSPKYARELATQYGAQFLYVHKPLTGKAKAVASSAKRSIVVGDKFITDGMFAKFLGVEFIKVDHAVSGDESLLVRFVNLVDDTLWRVVNLLRLMRATQWVKNALIFAPVFFAGDMFNVSEITAVVAAFFAFCFICSAGYVLNDVVDKADDKLHPQKYLRPLASGVVATSEAFFLSALLVFVGMGLLTWYAPQVMFVGLAYLVSSILYSFSLKHIAVVDLLMYVWFYFARILAGSLAAAVFLSPWLTLCIVFLALFLGVAKRYSQFVGQQSRNVLKDYSLKFLESMLYVSASMVVGFYAIYSILGAPSVVMAYSTIPVLGGIMRYLQLTLGGGGVEYPERLVFLDRGLQAAGVAWFVTVVSVFYL